MYTKLSLLICYGSCDDSFIENQSFGQMWRVGLLWKGDGWDFSFPRMICRHPRLIFLK